MPRREDDDVGPSDDRTAEPGTGHVYSLHVDPDRHRQGIGRRLMDEAMRRFAVAGTSTVSLWVVSDNHQARRFYEQLGWAADVDRPDT